MADVDLPPGIEPLDADVPSAPEEMASEVANSESTLTGEKTADEQPKKKNLYNDEYDLDEGIFLFLHMSSIFIHNLYFLYLYNKRFIF